MKHQILLYEDNKVFAESLKAVLSLTDDIECAHSFDNPTSILEAIEQYKPAMILMDIDMPELSGIDAVKKVRAQHPTLPIVMQTVFEENAQIYDCIMAGANGYILKKAGPTKYLEAIRDVINGGAPMSVGIAQKVLNVLRNPPNKKKENLVITEREQEILRELVEGLSYKMIASKFSISYHTVNAHIRKIYEKLHVHNATEAVTKAIKDKLVSLSALVYLVCENEELISWV